MFSSIFNIKMATQKCTNFDKLFFNAHYDICHNQFNKIVSSEFKNNQALLEPSYRKKNQKIKKKSKIKSIGTNLFTIPHEWHPPLNMERNKKAVKQPFKCYNI